MPGTTSSPISTVESKARVSPGLFSPRHVLQSMINFGVDLIFPPQCVGCGKIDSMWCSDCQRKLDDTNYPPWSSSIEPFTNISTTGVHEDVIREAVQGLKYGNARVLSQALGQRLVKRLAVENWTIDIVVPVPLHTTRLAERGYNQAQLLAEHVAQEIDLPCIPTAVSRHKYTNSQVTLSASERQTNVKDAFQANPEQVTDLRVLLIDDVYTTGATLSACAQAIIQAGAQAVYGLTVTVARL